MNLSVLGYDENWLTYGLLDPEWLRIQIEEFETSDDQNTEHYRYATLIRWINSKQSFTNEELDRFLEVCLNDSDSLMAGSAAKEIYLNPYISDTQARYIEGTFSSFGDWTQAHIVGRKLNCKFKNEPITQGLVDEAIQYLEQFNSKRYIELAIEKSEDPKMIQVFSESGFGKKIRNLASQKLRRLRKKDS